MEFIIDKPKVRQGYSYVLKTSWLQDAVTARKLITSIRLVYRSPHTEQTEWTLVRGTYWFPNQRVHYPRFYIEVEAVPVSLKPQIQTMVQTAVIPQLIDWMDQQEKLENNSTVLKENFRAVFKGESLVIS